LDDTFRESYIRKKSWIVLAPLQQLMQKIPNQGVKEGKISYLLKEFTVCGEWWPIKN